MLGIDIEQCDRFTDWGAGKLKRIFTENEISYAQKQQNFSQHLCGFYCVKEAFVKATNNKTIKFNKIEVLHDASGKPFINKTEYVSSILNNKNVEISISHTANYAAAVVQIN